MCEGVVAMSCVGPYPMASVSPDKKRTSKTKYTALQAQDFDRKVRFRLEKLRDIQDLVGKAIANVPAIEGPTQQKAAALERTIKDLDDAFKAIGEAWFDGTRGTKHSVWC